MTITIKSTPYLVRMEGIICRVWDGFTDDGQEVKVFVDSITTGPIPGHDGLVMEELPIDGPSPRLVRLAELFPD